MEFTNSRPQSFPIQPELDLAGESSDEKPGAPADGDAEHMHEWCRCNTDLCTDFQSLSGLSSVYVCVSSVADSYNHMHIIQTSLPRLMVRPSSAVKVWRDRSGNVYMSMYPPAGP